MTSSSSMNFQKHEKVKSRWLQSSQMEMMMEESQSSLEMSDTITDVSPSDINESTDCSSELKSMEARRSGRTGSSKTDYRRLNGSKTTPQKIKQNLASKTPTKKSRKKLRLVNTSEIDEDIFKESISQESNILSPLAYNVVEIDDGLPQKSSRASLSRQLALNPKNEKDNNINALDKSKDSDVPYETECLDVNNTILKMASIPSDDYFSSEKLFENVKETNERCTTNESIPLQLHYSEDNDFISGDIDALKNEVLNIKLDTLALTSYNEHGFVKSNKHTRTHLCNEEKTYQTNPVKQFPSEFENFKCYPIYKSKKVRSKSCDFLSKKINVHNTFRRYKSFDDINKSENSNVDFSKFQTSRKKKRRQSKRIKPKNNCIEILNDIKVPEVNYDQVADEIYAEHKNQLLIARMNDKEFDEKLKFTNFTLINENLYRPNRQTLKLFPSENSSLRKLKPRVISADINDYCECTLSKEDIVKGNIGCDDRCLNRLLKVECGSSCSLKRYCTNKQFQNKQFKKTNIIKTEKKGYGICAVEDIPKGVLISEYVGEVIDYNEMCNRLTKKEYKNLNYLVQLNPDEIIDSTSKGNITRFINHSCDPNSIGEKWCVLGQSRIGFFSTRDIKKGEEITFDYSFEIFSNDPQICYCGSSKCRGYISKALQNTGLSSSEDSDDNNTSENLNASKSEERQRKKTILKKRTAFNDKNKLQELSRQLKEIAKLKTGNRADQEMATLNLKRLMIHTTDSTSRLHVLKFMREQDVNKRLFMDFSGFLSIIHNWMTSNENESFKIMILEILTELPITNRNAITKFKVLDVVAEWAKIPQDVKAKIESLEYPASDLQKHCQEIDNIFPTNNKDNKMAVHGLIEKARDLWKKWIVLKMVFKIPKKIDKHKPSEELMNSSKIVEDLSPNFPMDITALDRRTYKMPNKFIKKVQNQQTIPLDRLKLRKEYELKVEQKRQNMFRKKVMDDWHSKMEGVMNKKPDRSYLQHQQQTLNLLSHDITVLNPNNEFSKPSRWDCSSQGTHISQNSIVNYNMQNPHLNFIPPQPQPLNQYLQYSYMQPHNMFLGCHPVNQPTYLNASLPPPPNQPFSSQQDDNSTIFDKPEHQISEQSNQSPANRLIKLTETNVFNLINDSLHKHCSSDKNADSKIENPKKLCSRTVQSGADLLARIKVISNSYKNQPSKLIKIQHLKQNNGNAKGKTAPLSGVILKSVCDKNKRIKFINEPAGVTSNTISKDLMPTPKTVILSKKNQFANSILISLLKKAKLEKENLGFKKFVLPNLNSDVVTCFETDKEIKLYKSMKPKVIKKTVALVKTKNGQKFVIKRYWGIKHKGLKGKHDKIPATKRNMMRKGNIHKLSLKNGLINTKKSALKNKNNINANDYSKKPKEKRVTFWIEGETSPIFPNSEVRPINLNRNIVKQKPLMKCHPFKVRNKPKSLLKSSVQGGSLQFSLEQSSEMTNDHIITPIVKKFKASRNKRASLRDNATDLEQLRSQRKNMIPESMMSLSVDVLKLIPDNKKEMKKVIDYYHLMATIIVKILGSYAKKTCQQGRIRSDEDFKFLAKKINENVLLKELQIKKVDKLRITNNTKAKVAEYIKKYMSRFGDVYKRKPNEQTNHHKSK